MIRPASRPWAVEAVWEVLCRIGGVRLGQGELAAHPFRAASVATMRFAFPLLSAIATLLALTGGASAAEPVRDGEPRTGSNFLLPFDNSRFDATKIGGTFRIFDDTSKGINPLLDNDANVHDLHRAINDPLAMRPYWNPEKWMGVLAESVQVSDDWKVWTFTIRPGVLWQRPTIATKPEFTWLDKDVPLTSGDFKFALDTILNPGVDCPQIRNYYQDLEAVETPDERTLVLKWKKTMYASIETSLDIDPLPRHIYGSNKDGTAIPAERFAQAFNKHWFDELRGAVGVGQFRLESYIPDQIARFVQYPKAWSRTRHADAIEWRLDVKKPEAELVGFKNGQASVLSMTPLQYKSEILDGKEPRFAPFKEDDPKSGRSGELGWEKVRRHGYYYIGWNLRRPLFAELKTRIALHLAFPTKRIIREVFHGLGREVQSEIPEESLYYNKTLKPYVFDPKQAKALLAEAGWADSDGDGLLDRKIDGKKIDFSFTVRYYANSPEYDNTLLIYKNELRKIGIELKPEPKEWKDLTRVYEDHDFDAMVGGWRTDWNIDFYQIWHSSQADVPGGSNHYGFKNPRVDQLAEKLRDTFPMAERAAIAQEIQAIIFEQQPILHIRSAEGVIAWQNRPAPGAAPSPWRWLGGITDNFDKLHPLENGKPVYTYLKP
ncbi:peptide-binding protein [Planctomycetota bacterium]|nr:peptide-binding protein [Planctomycetota bacterium]